MNLPPAQLNAIHREEGVRSRARGLFNLLRKLEQERITGLVHIQGHEGEVLGQVMVASGRLCFAAPAERQAPIGELLVEEDPSFRERLDLAVARARRAKRRLCESLLDDGALPIERLRTALRGQISRSLLSLARAGGSEVVFRIVPARDDYDRRLTFSSLDVFVAAASLLDAAPADEARRLFDEYAACADAAVLLTHWGDANALPLPVAARGIEELGLAEVITLARTAEALLRPRLFCSVGDEARIVVLSGPQGVWVCGRGRMRLVLIRTGPEFMAGQIVGFALRVWAAQTPTDAALTCTQRRPGPHSED